MKFGDLKRAAPSVTMAAALFVAGCAGQQSGPGPNSGYAGYGSAPQQNYLPPQSSLDFQGHRISLGQGACTIAFREGGSAKFLQYGSMQGAVVFEIKNFVAAEFPNGRTDPEFKHTQDGIKFANLIRATADSTRDLCRQTFGPQNFPGPNAPQYSPQSSNLLSLDAG